ncbi:MAG TPA: galactokinase [Terriglobales bacterium]|nr:galactokinase [Terriglobales bacterium]
MQVEQSTGFEDLIQKLRLDFHSHFEGNPRFFRAPGRVNLIGEHTDYNEGLVMPAAIGFDTWVAAAPSDAAELAVCSAQQRAKATFPAAETNPRRRGDWTDYVRGVQVQLERAGIRSRGVNMLVDGHVPIGAGLSSSAAIEVATAVALLDVAGSELDSVAIARLCQRAENEFVGARCGIMDQFTSLHGQRGRAILLDCRSLEYRPLPLPNGVKLVICNTMVRHSLAAGEYNARRAECEACVRELSAIDSGIRALRDVSEDELPGVAEKVPEPLMRRLRHVVTENARVLRAGKALESGDMKGLGEFMYESHVSLRDDYQVSCRELDLMVELADGIPGVIGARMTGGGFGGCTINLVERNAVDGFVEEVSKGYQEKMSITPEIYVTEANDGAARVG